jgi:hypothetical protein
MPNHLHGVIILVDADLRAGPENQGAHVGAPLPETAVGADLRVGPYQQGAHIGAPLPETAVGADLHVGPVQQGAHIGAPPRGQSSEPTSVRRLIQCFRTMTTHETMGGSSHPGSLGSGAGSGNAAATTPSSALNAS